MKFFLFLLFLLLLFDSLQGSTLPHKRCTRGLNTTLQTNFNGIYQRRNPCTNAEIETSSYVASHEFHHHTKENNWGDYSHKCSSIISSFLQAIGNLVRFNNKQNGTFNFHINTSISQKQDRSDLGKQKSCDSMPTVIIEATDCEISPRSSCKSDETENKGKVVSFGGTFTNNRNPNQPTSTPGTADQNQKYEEMVTEQPEEIIYFDEYPTTTIPPQKTTVQYQPQPPMQEVKGRWQQDENSWTETQRQPIQTEYSPAVFTDISQQNTGEPKVFETSNSDESSVDLTTPYASTEYDSLRSDTNGLRNSPNSTPNPLIYYSTTRTDFEEKSQDLNLKEPLPGNWGGKVPYNQRLDFVSPPEQILTTKSPPRTDRTPSSEEYQPADFEATRKTLPGFNYHPQVSDSFPPTTHVSEYDELSAQNPVTTLPQRDDFYTEGGEFSEGQTQYSPGFTTPTTQTPSFDNISNHPARFSKFSTFDQKTQNAEENLSSVTVPNPNHDSKERSTMSDNPQIFQPVNTPKIPSPQSLIKTDFSEFPETQLLPPPLPFTYERIPDYSSQYPNIRETQMTDTDSAKTQTQDTFTQPMQPLVDEDPQTFPLEQQPIENVKVFQPGPLSTQRYEEEAMTTDFQTTTGLEPLQDSKEPQPLQDLDKQYAIDDRETGQKPDYLRQQFPTFLQPDSQIKGNTIAPGFRSTFYPQGPTEILQPRSPSVEDGMTPIQFSTTPIPDYVNDRESTKLEPTFMNPQNVNTLKQFQSQLTDELPQPPSAEQQGNFEDPLSRYTTTETFKDEFQTEAGPTYQPSPQFDNNENIALTPEQQEISNQPEPQFITEAPDVSNENPEYRFISPETTPSQFQRTPIPEYTDNGQAIDVTTVSPQNLNPFVQSESQLRGDAPFRQFPQAYSPKMEGIEIPQSQPTEVKTRNEDEFQTTTKNQMETLNNDNQYEVERITEIPNSAFFNRETSNTFVGPKLEPPLNAPLRQFPPTATSERPTDNFEIPQPGRTTPEIFEEKDLTNDFQTTQESEYQLQSNRQTDGDRAEIPDSSLLNSQASNFDELKPPMASNYINPRRVSPNFISEQNPRKNFEMQPFEGRKEESHLEYGNFRQQPNAFPQFQPPIMPSVQQPIEGFESPSIQTIKEETVTTDYQTTAEPEHQTTLESTPNDREIGNESNYGSIQQQIPNTYGQSESQFRGNAPNQQLPPQVYQSDNVTPFTGITSMPPMADASNLNIGNRYETLYDNRPTENRRDFQASEMNFNHNSQDDYTTPTPFYGSKPTPNENKPPQEVEHSVETAERPSTAFKEESFEGSAPTSAGSENGLSGALPSPAFVPRYPGQVLNENVTTPIPNAPALYSEHTSPKISSLRWQSPAENHTFGSPAGTTGYNYRDPTFSGPLGMPVRPFDTFRAPYIPNGRPQFDGNPGRNDASSLPVSQDLPYYPQHPDNAGAPEKYRLQSETPDIRQPMYGPDFRNERPVFNNRFPVPPGRYSDRPAYPGMRPFQTSDTNRHYLNEFSPENQMQREDDNYRSERPLMNSEIAPPPASFRNPQFEQDYERTQSARFSNNRPELPFPPNFPSNERFPNDAQLGFRKPLRSDEFRHDTKLEQPPPPTEFQSNRELGPIRRFPVTPEAAEFRPGGFNRRPSSTQEIRYYPDQQINDPKNRFYPVSSPMEIPTFPEQQNQQGNPVEALQRPSVNDQLSTRTSPPQSQPMNFPPTDLSNVRENSQDSFPPRDQYPTEVSPPRAVSESQEAVNYSQTETHSELESQSLISTPGNDQSVPNEFQPTYSSESQSETTLPHWNDRSVTLSEQRVSDVAPGNEHQISNSFIQPENLGNQQELRAPFPSEPNSNLNYFPSTVSPKLTTKINEETISTTEFPAQPSKPYAELPSEYYSRDNGNQQVLATEEYDRRALASEAKLPLNLERSPMSSIEATPIPMQPNFESQQAQDNIPMNPPSNADKPQPQPSLDYTTDISGYETTGNTAQTFDNNSPQQLEPVLNRLSYSPNAFPREFHEHQTYVQDNRETVLPSRNLEQGLNAPVPGRPDEQFSLQTPAVTMTPYDPLRKAQTIAETAELIENASPQTQSSTVVKYDKETQATDLSSPAPLLQPQMALKYSVPLSEDKSANISPDGQLLVTSAPTEFSSTPPMNYEKISDRNIFSSAELQEMNGQPLTQYASPSTHQTQTVEYSTEEIINDSPVAMTPPSNFPNQNRSPNSFNPPHEFQPVNTDQTFQRQSPPGQFDSAAPPQNPNYFVPETQGPIYDRQITDAKPIIREDRQFISYDEQQQAQRDTYPERGFSENGSESTKPLQTSQKQAQTYIEDITKVSGFPTSVNSETNDRELASTSSTSPENFTLLVTPIPSFAPQEHQSSKTTKVVEEILTTEFPMTDSGADSQLAYATKLLNGNAGNKELEILQEDRKTPEAEKSEPPAESLSYSDRLSNVNMRRRSDKAQFFDEKYPPQYFEKNNEQQVESSMRGNPVYVPERPEQRNPMFYQNRNVSPQSEDMLTRQDETTPDFRGRNPMDRQLFDSRKPNQPEADFPLESGYHNSQQKMTRSMMYTSNNEPARYPPMNDEQHSNPLLHTMQSHLAFPLHDHPQQVNAYSQTDSEDPKNSFAPVPPYPRNQEFERNFVPSGGVVDQPQPDSLVSDLNNPSNMPDLPATGRFGYMSRPLMNPWGRSSGRVVSTPERF